jgi:signal transduction histidine kinase
MAERNRIAREIHDTLAQGYVGISLQLEILGELLRHNRRDAAITQLATTKDLVREGLDDARQSIWALRSQDTSEHTLPVRLRRLVEQAQTDSLTADFALHGAFRSMPPGTEREILRIAQEAIQNVKRHAEASRLSVHLDYEDEAIIVSVTDDGKGFEWEDGIPNNDHTTQREGVLKEQRHYGLVGMKERAALIGAELSIRSTPREGTVVTLRVPLAGLESLDTANERLINDQV